MKQMQEKRFEVCLLFLQHLSPFAINSRKYLEKFEGISKHLTVQLGKNTT
jgi:hypothetical protein